MYAIRSYYARKMVLSKSTIPHALLVDEADATNLMRLREELREAGEREGTRITVLPVILSAVAASLGRHPAMNATLDEEKQEIVRWSRCVITSYSIHYTKLYENRDGAVGEPVLRDRFPEPVPPVGPVHLVSVRKVEATAPHVGPQFPPGYRVEGAPLVGGFQMEISYNFV